MYKSGFYRSLPTTENFSLINMISVNKRTVILFMYLSYISELVCVRILVKRLGMVSG